MHQPIGDGRSTNLQRPICVDQHMFPLDMAMEHHAWHGAHSPAQNSDVDQRRRLSRLPQRVHQDGSGLVRDAARRDGEMTASWTSVPPELKTSAVGWSSGLEATEQRITDQQPPFAGEDDSWQLHQLLDHGWISALGRGHRLRRARSREFQFAAEHVLLQDSRLDRSLVGRVARAGIRSYLGWTLRGDGRLASHRVCPRARPTN